MTINYDTTSRIILDIAIPVRDPIMFNLAELQTFITEHSDGTLDASIGYLGQGWEILLSIDPVIKLSYAPIGTFDEHLEGNVWHVAEFVENKSAVAGIFSIGSNYYIDAPAPQWKAAKLLWDFLEVNLDGRYGVTFAENLVGSVFFGKSRLSLDRMRDLLAQPFSAEALAYLQGWGQEGRMALKHPIAGTIADVAWFVNEHDKEPSWLIFEDDITQRLSQCGTESDLAASVFANAPNVRIVQALSENGSRFIQRTFIPGSAGNDVKMAVWPNTRLNDPHDSIAVRRRSLPSWEIGSLDLWSSVGSFHPLIAEHMATSDFIVYALSIDTDTPDATWGNASLGRVPATEEMFARVEQWLNENGITPDAALIGLDLMSGKAEDENEKEYDIQDYDLRLWLQRQDWKNRSQFVDALCGDALEEIGTFLDKTPREHSFYFSNHVFRVDANGLAALLEHEDVHYIAFFDIPKSVETLTLKTLTQQQRDDTSEPSLPDFMHKRLGSRFSSDSHSGGAESTVFYRDDDIRLFIESQMLGIADDITRSNTPKPIAKDLARKLMDAMRKDMDNIDDDVVLRFNSAEPTTVEITKWHEDKSITDCAYFDVRAGCWTPSADR